MPSIYSQCERALVVRLSYHDSQYLATTLSPKGFDNFRCGY
jgi:hypothetical protein